MYGFGLIWLASIIGLLVVWGGYIAFRYFRAKADAVAIWEATHDTDPALKKTTQSRYEHAYMRVHGPRPAIYGALACLAALFVMPTSFKIAEWVWNQFWNASGRAGDLEAGFAPWLFGMTVMMIGSWIGIGALFAQLYHRNRPHSIERELTRLQDN